MPRTVATKTTLRFKPLCHSTSAGNQACLPVTSARRLVKIPIGKFDNQSTVKGTTVAELGNRNRPLDMIVYRKMVRTLS